MENDFIAYNLALISNLSIRINIINEDIKFGIKAILFYTLRLFSIIKVSILSRARVPGFDTRFGNMLSFLLPLI